MRFKPTGQETATSRTMPANPVPANGFDFPRHMHHLCHDACTRLPELQHIDMQRVAVTFSQARKQVPHGLYASLTPMRFEGGALLDTTEERHYTVQRLFDADGRDAALEAAGFQTSGLHGSMRVAGLTAVYARTFKYWLDDDSTDFGPTMAYLDRELSKAAGWDRRVEKGFGKASSICGKITKRCRNFSLKKSKYCCISWLFVSTLPLKLAYLLSVFTDSVDLKIEDLGQTIEPIYIGVGPAQDVIVNGINYRVDIISGITDTNAVISVSRC
mgnify:CR=1 FL=1